MPAFSLLELTMVMFIISIIASIAIPRYGASESNFRVERAAKRIGEDLAYASVLARVGSTTVKVGFKDGDKDDESLYWFEDHEDPDHPGRLYTVVLRDEPYRVQLSTAPDNIEFLPDGLPKDTRVFIVQRGNAIRSVTIHAETGEVTIN